CNCGAAVPATPDPISLSDGAKRFSEHDFSLAGSVLPIERDFSSRPAGASGDTLITTPLGFANWRWGLLPELHLGDDWNLSGIAGLSTPDGGQFRFTKSVTVMVPTTSTTYPTKNPDY